MRIGTRRSALALAQARYVADLLGGGELVPIATAGDRGAGASDKSRWVAELEDALLAKRIDLAVHSAKDLPGELPPGLALLGAPARAPAHDVLCGASGLAELGPSDRVGTSSVRRIAQLRAAREDVDVVALRGNVDTRLEKLAGGREGVRAIVLACAALARLGREDAVGCALDPTRFVPAPGQGTLALEGRSDDEAAAAAAGAITDASAFACLLAERALARALGADCHTPLGAHAAPAEEGDSMLLRGWAGLPDGSAWVGDELTGPLARPEALGIEVAGRMRAAGARELLHTAQEMADVAGS